MPVGLFSFSKAFAGVEVGIKEMEDGIWVVSFLDYDLGYFDDKSKKVEPITDPFGKSVNHVYGIKCKA